MTNIKPTIEDLYGMEEGWDVMDYVHAFADPRQIILSWPVFFPEFEEVDGNVILGPIFPEQREALRQKLAASETEIGLESYRWTEVPYLFVNRTALSDAQNYTLAELIAKAWLLKLKDDFPEQAWTTRVLPPEETGGLVGVAFGNT